MIVRILRDCSEEIGFYTHLTCDPGYNRQQDDEPYNVSHWLVLPQIIAEDFKNQTELKRLDNKKSYGIYEMDEEDIALWLLKI